MLSSEPQRIQALNSSDISEAQVKQQGPAQPWHKTKLSYPQPHCTHQNPSTQHHKHIMASLHITFTNDDLVPVTPRFTDDLPLQVKRTTQWLQISSWRPPCYFVTSNCNTQEPVELINNKWYWLVIVNDTLCTRASNIISQNNNVLGWWLPTDPAHPDYHPLSTQHGSTFGFNPDSSLSSGSSTTTVHTAPNPSKLPDLISPNINLTSSDPNNILSPVDQLSTGTIISLQGPLSLDLPDTTNAPVNLINMLVAATGTGGGSSGGTRGTTHTPGGMNGTVSTIFDSTQSKADDLWSQFRCYKLLNCNKDTMNKPFD